MSANRATDTRFLLSYDVPEHQKEQFMKFVKEGQKRADGTFEEDAETGAEMTGVIAWLRDNGLNDTKIYTVEKPGGALLFVATADRTIPANLEQPDWSDIPG